MPWASLLLNRWVIGALAMAALAVAVGVQTHRLDAAQARLTTLHAKYDLFVTEVQQIGETQIAKNKEIAAKQEKTSRETAKSYQARLNAINADYARLRGSQSADSSPTAPVATTPAPVDDTARDSELLAVLRAAEIQTGTLIELQNWVRNTLK